MATRYQIIVRDQAGTQVAILTDWRSLEYTKEVNRVGTYRVVIDGEIPVVDLFELDGIIEIKRSDLASSPTIPIYTDFFGLHRDATRSTIGQLSTYSSGGVDFNHLLNRHMINFRETSAGANKSDVGETVIKDYVDENAGPGATSPPRISSGVFPSFTVQTTAGGGSAWAGDRAFKNLLDVLLEISDATGVDYEVVQGPTPTTFIFTAKARPLGADRSFGNTAGNGAIVFSLGFGNMEAPRYSLLRRGEVNKIIVLGQGQPASRVVEERTTSATGDSPLNTIESVRPANQEASVPALQNVGDAFLEILQANETFAFDVIQTNSSRYGRDYFLGDIVTARYKDIERDLQIVGVTVNVDPGVGEEISIKVSSVI